MYYDLEFLNTQILTTKQREIVDSLRKQWSDKRFLSRKQRDWIKRTCAAVKKRPRCAKVLDYLKENAHELSEKHTAVVDGLCKSFDEHGSLTDKQFEFACGIADSHFDSKQSKNWDNYNQKLQHTA